MQKVRQRGFTIVELLIVIIVIGILATLVLVAYSNVSDQAKSSAAKNDLEQIAKQLNLYKENTGGGSAYPADASSLSYSSGTSVQYSVNNTVSPATYCVTAANGNKSYWVSNTSQTPTAGGCPGHGINGQSPITNLQTNTQLAIDSSGFSTQTPSGNTSSRTTGSGPNGEATFNVITTASGVLRIAFRSAGINGTAGTQYQFSFYLYSSVAAAGSVIEVNYNNSTWVSLPITDVTAGWKRYSAVGTIPSGATGFATAQLVTYGTNVPTGASFKMTDVMITQGPTLYNFADGNSPNWIWNGTTNASTSTGPAL